MQTSQLIPDLAELRRVIEGDDEEDDDDDDDDDDDGINMDLDDLEGIDGIEDDGDPDGGAYYDEGDEMDEMDEDGFGEYDDEDEDEDEEEDEDEQVWTSPAEFAGVDLITPRRSYKGAKNMETVKDCELATAIVKDPRG